MNMERIFQITAILVGVFAAVYLFIHWGGGVLLFWLPRKSRLRQAVERAQRSSGDIGSSLLLAGMIGFGLLGLLALLTLIRLALTRPAEAWVFLGENAPEVSLGVVTVGLIMALVRDQSAIVPPGVSPEICQQIEDAWNTGDLIRWAVLYLLHAPEGERESFVEALKAGFPKQDVDFILQRVEQERRLLAMRKAR